MFGQFFWREIILVTSNGIKAGKRTREEAKKFEKCKQREADEGEEEKFSMKIIVKLREIERETKHLFTTVSYQIMFSLLIFASLPHVFCNTR